MTPTPIAPFQRDDGPLKGLQERNPLAFLTKGDTEGTMTLRPKGGPEMVIEFSYAEMTHWGRPVHLWHLKGRTIAEVDHPEETEWQMYQDYPRDLMPKEASFAYFLSNLETRKLIEKGMGQS